MVLLFLGDVAILHHPAQDVGLTLPGPLITGIRIITGGRLGQSGQERGFGKFKIPRSFSEINLRGRFNPISAVAKINMIEIEIQNFLFRKGTVDLIGQDGFLDFAAVTFFRGQIEGLGDLLRNGAAPLDNPSGPEISEKGPGNALHVKTAVFKKPGIFSGQKGFDDQGWDFLESDQLTIFHVEFVDQFIIVRVNPGGDAWPVFLQCGNAGQIPKNDIIEDAAAHQQGQQEKENKHDQNTAGRTPVSCHWMLRSFDHLIQPWAFPGCLPLLLFGRSRCRFPPECRDACAPLTGRPGC